VPIAAASFQTSGSGSEGAAPDRHELSFLVRHVNVDDANRAANLAHALLC
jgi:hypothetical protein